jgi:transcription elongation GreA/GreB family factor
VDKSALRQAIIAQLQRELALQSNAAHESRSEATDQESRAEGQYDMRGQSAAYLAAGQAKLAGEIADAIAAYRTLALPHFGPADPVAVGALVTLARGGRELCYFVGPARGGLEVAVEGRTITVITAASTLGRGLLGKRTGDRLPAPSGGAPGPTIAGIE